MRWASSIRADGELELALDTACGELQHQLDADQPDLLLAFVSREHQARSHQLPGLLHERFPAATLLGCSAGGVIGNGRELEQQAGLALVGARLPGVEIKPFSAAADQMLEPAPPAEERECWRELIGLDEGPDPHLLLLPDPFTWAGPELLASLDRAFPAGVKLGGLASGGSRAGEHRLFCDRSVHPRGLVGVALRGNIEIEPVVAQGCRPIGEPMFVTRSQRNVIVELDGRPAIESLRALFEGLDSEDRALARQSLFIGLVMNPRLEVHGQGDFLIRNLVGIDPNSGAIAIAAALEPNAIVQFHLRDAETSAAELRGLLAEQARRTPSNEAIEAALLFSCLGRGVGLYGQPDHDSTVLREQLGADLPLGGFFCNGEIGPIAGRTYLHGYTSAIALVRAAAMS